MAVAPRDGLPGIELAAKSGRNNSRSESCRTGRRPCPQSGPLWWPPNSEPAYRRSKLGQFEVCTRTVYIALPNSMHAEYTIRAAKAGKHVLCEKPMATSVEDCKKMIEACRSANRKLMIAYRCQYEPTNLRAIQLIREGKLGKIQAIESANGFNERLGEWRLDKKLAGGGPLMDVGIYCLNACRYLTGEEPEKLQGYSSVLDKDGRFDTVEENLSFTMQFPSGILASVSTTYGAPMNSFFRVHGSRGILEADPAFNYDGLRLKARIGREKPLDEQNTEKDPAQ